MTYHITLKNNERHAHKNATHMFEEVSNGSVFEISLLGDYDQWK